MHLDALQQILKLTKSLPQLIKEDSVRIMRMLVMFDLPTGNKAERKSYAEFRKFLIEDGFHMEQFSIYSKVLLTRESGSKHIKRIQAHLPQAGIITVLELTEKQYEDRLQLLNTTPAPKVEAEKAQLTLVF